MEKTLISAEEYQDTVKEFQLLVSWPFIFYRLIFLGILVMGGISITPITFWAAVFFFLPWKKFAGCYARHYLDKRYVIVDQYSLPMKS